MRICDYCENEITPAEWLVTLSDGKVYHYKCHYEKTFVPVTALAVLLQKFKWDDDVADVLEAEIPEEIKNKILNKFNKMKKEKKR